MPKERQGDPAADEVRPEFRDEAGSREADDFGDLGAEDTGPSGLGAGSGTGSGHEYPGRAADDVRDVEDEPEDEPDDEPEDEPDDER